MKKYFVKTDLKYSINPKPTRLIIPSSSFVYSFCRLCKKYVSPKEAVYLKNAVENRKDQRIFTMCKDCANLVYLMNIDEDTKIIVEE